LKGTRKHGEYVRRNCQMWGDTKRPRGGEGLNDARAIRTGGKEKVKLQSMNKVRGSKRVSKEGCKKNILMGRRALFSGRRTTGKGGQRGRIPLPLMASPGALDRKFATRRRPW